MLLRSQHRFQQGKKRLGPDLDPMLRQDNEKTNNLSRNMREGAVTKDYWLTTEMRSRHAFEVAT